ncbi:MAG: rhomboid family intramembrane serine protease [Armatimonadetes bacterium]|jgi:membrane associated rhomboid family serine protease|nr:rhomboid family intramembrane serine protease [Armatimonadota bacterium]
MSETKQTTLATNMANWPLLTLGIIGLNVLVYLSIFRESTPGYPDINPTRLYGLVPAHLKVGKMLTSNFVHASAGHLLVNMTMLYIFGRNVERSMGKLEYGLIYIGACFASSIMHAAMVLAAFPVYYSEQPVIGASGAVAGVVAIYAVRYHRKVFDIFGLYIPALWVIAAWLIMQLAFAIVGLYKDSFWGMGLKQVSYWSHLGGFSFGLLVALAGNMALHGEREHLIDEARRLYDNGSILEATQRYEALIKCDPDNAFAHAELGRFWAILEEEEQSLPYYHRAIEWYLSQGREAEALACADEMKRFWPKAAISASTRFRFASYLEESGHTQKAIRALRRLAEDVPDSVEAEMALLKIGQLLLSFERDPSAAISTIEGFLTRYPDSEWKQFAEEVIRKAQA